MKHKQRRSQSRKQTSSNKRWCKHKLTTRNITYCYNKKGGAIISTPPIFISNAFEMKEHYNGVDIESLKSKFSSILNSFNKPPSNIYIAIGSAIHEDNDFSEFQTFPVFLNKSDTNLVILYDDFTNYRNKEFLRRRMAEYTNWKFLVIQRNHTNESLLINVLRIINNLKRVVNTVLETLQENNVSRWILCNYVAFRAPNRVEQTIGRQIHEFLKQIAMSASTETIVMTWSYMDTSHVFHILDEQPRTKLRIVPL